MFNSILMVCVGNVCRSPMAEMLLRHKLAAKQKNIQVASAGLGALIGHGTDANAQMLMNKMNIDTSKHQARQLNTNIIAKYDLILTMEKDHITTIHNIALTSKGKVHLLGKWSDFEIPDPYKQSQHEFEVALDLIERGVDEWLEKF